MFSALFKLNGDGRDHRNSLAPPIIIAYPSEILFLCFPLLRLIDWSIIWRNSLHSPFSMYKLVQTLISPSNTANASPKAS